jgi:hypothetical protein
MEVVKMGKKDKKGKKKNDLFGFIEPVGANAFQNLQLGGKKDKYEKRDNNKEKFKGKDFENTFMIKSIEDINQKVIEIKKNDINSLDVFKEKLLDSRFVDSVYNTIVKAINKNDDEEYEYSKSLTPLASYLLEFALENKNNLEESSMQILLSVIEKLGKGRAKELKSKLKESGVKINKELIKEIGFVIPSDDIIKPRQNIFELVMDVNRAIYDFANNPKEETKLEKTKHIKKLYKSLFGEENLESCANGCL